MLLLRPAFSYQLKAGWSAVIGYAYIGTWKEETSKRSFELEHRAWEQLIIESKVGLVDITNRLRLEQRFLDNTGGFAFAQRICYLLRSEWQLSQSGEKNKGPFTVQQNELFFNIQNKEQVNNRFFDQNRAYAGIGYYFSKVLNVEMGYMYRYQISDGSEIHHIVQLTIGTQL